MAQIVPKKLFLGPGKIHYQKLEDKTAYDWISWKIMYKE